MSLSFIVMTRNGGWRLERLLQNIGNRASEIIVGVDSSSTDDTAERARQYTSHVIDVDNPQGFIEPHIAGLFRRCSADWVLRLDDDELLSDNFDPSSLGSSAFDQFDLIGFPRAWVISVDPLLYIGTGKERGDLVPQFRLMRRSADWNFIDRIHTPGFEMKPAKVVSDVYIYHMNLLDQPYSDRQRKYAFYQSHRDAPWNKTYLLQPPELVRDGQGLPCEPSMFPPIDLIRKNSSQYVKT